MVDDDDFGVAKESVERGRRARIVAASARIMQLYGRGGSIIVVVVLVHVLCVFSVPPNFFRHEREDWIISLFFVRTS